MLENSIALENFAALENFKCPHQESNLDLRFRKPPFYPLNYGSFDLILLQRASLRFI
jgi:hypothetical protein